jgi:NADPH2:quinone reductase
MRAAVLHEFGPPEMLRTEEVPDPVPGPGQVVVEVSAAGITFVETQVRAGRPPHPAMAPALPAILGNRVAGVVAGRPVITTTGGLGGYAERVAVPADGLIEVPDGVEPEAGLALLADGRTAVSLLRAAAPQPGETLLVEAAAGGVGTLLVQLARDAGARVIAAARGAAKVALCADLGAEETVDYGEPGWAEGLSVDVVFDGVGGEVGRAALEALRPGGRFVRYGMASGAFTDVPEDRDVELVGLTRPTPEQMGELTRAALALAAGGRLRAVIGQTFALDHAAAAHAAIEERRTVGKTLLLTRG